nr:pilin N-terminal domain-containing protein [Enterococcus rivorum]
MVALFFTILSAIFFVKSSVVAETSSGDSTLGIVIHRLVVKSDQVVIQNDGKEIDSMKLKELSGLNGVTFSVYELTEQLDSLIKEGMTIEQAQLQLIRKKYSLNTLVPIRSIVTDTVDGEDGIARVALPTLVNKKQAFLIIETATTDKVALKSDPIVLVTPVYNQHGELMSTVHIYPKSRIEETPKEPLEPKKNVVPIDEKKPRFLPSTGEMFQSKLFLIGVVLLVLSGLLYYIVNRKIKKRVAIK